MRRKTIAIFAAAAVLAHCSCALCYARKVAKDYKKSNKEIRRVCSDARRLARRIKALADTRGKNYVLNPREIAGIAKDAKRLKKRITRIVEKRGLGAALAAARNFGDVRDSMKNLNRLLEKYGRGALLKAGDILKTVAVIALKGMG